MVNLADRLVLDVLAPRAAAVVLAGVLVFSAVELVDLANMSAGEDSAQTSSVRRYPLRLPLVVVLVSPIAALVAGCWATMHLRRTGQLTALAAAALGPRRALASYPIAGLGWAVAVWALAEFVAPVGLATWSAETPRASDVRWVSTGDLLYRAGRQEPDGYHDVLIFALDARGLPTQRYEAARAERGEHGWVLDDVWVSTAGERPRQHTRLDAPGPLHAPGVHTLPQELTGPELARASRAARGTGADEAPLMAERGLRVALSLACLICLVIGSVVGARQGARPGRAAASIAVVGVVYWLLVSSCWTLATAGQLEGWMVAVVPSAALAIPGLLGWFVALR